MHEFSLAQNLMEQLLGLAEQHKAEIITKVTVLIGPFSGVVPDSFAFGFDVLKKEHPVTINAVLELETPPPEYRCSVCGRIVRQNRTTDEPSCRLLFAEERSCPQCGTRELFPVGGDELLLKQLEME